MFWPGWFDGIPPRKAPEVPPVWLALLAIPAALRAAICFAAAPASRLEKNADESGVFAAGETGGAATKEVRWFCCLLASWEFCCLYRVMLAGRRE